ncbi:hypothetical protein MP638_000687 [Amoeboaphelidium occidentale]|nr:hypothetical protein MP638_000687 [Amoeboaphelidium occidentale]
MYGDLALKLIKEIKRNPTQLTTHEGELVRSIQNETTHIYSEAEALLGKASTGGLDSLSTLERSFLSVASTVAARNKRCLLAYHSHRMQLIAEIVRLRRCDGGGSKLPPKDLRAKMSQDEIAFYKEYASALNRMRAMFLDFVDIGGKMSVPMSLYVQVMALRDIEFETASDVDGDDSGKRVKLCAGHVDYLKREDVEQLIEQGFLVQLE